MTSEHHDPERTLPPTDSAVVDEVWGQFSEEWQPRDEHDISIPEGPFERQEDVRRKSTSDPRRDQIQRKKEKPQII